MKKEVLQVVEICDYCQKEDEYCAYHCLRCEKAACYDCKKKNFSEFREMAYASNSLYYCVDCENALALERTDKLYLALIEMAKLHYDLEQSCKRYDTLLKMQEQLIRTLRGKSD